MALTPNLASTSLKPEAAKSWVSPNAKSGKGLLYVGWIGGRGGSEIEIYPLKGKNQKPIGQISAPGQDLPGLTVDSKRNLWVTNQFRVSDTVLSPGNDNPFANTQ